MTQRHAFPPFAFGRPEVEAAGKRVLGMRYRLLPYLYSAMEAAHRSGAPIMRPLWLNFPGDARTFKNNRRVGGLHAAF